MTMSLSFMHDVLIHLPKNDDAKVILANNV